MTRFPEKLHAKLNLRQQNDALRSLGQPSNKVDFSSNDYLGFSRSESLFEEVHQYLKKHHYTHNGATGSRLLTGNHPLYTEVEHTLSGFHKAESALLFNSGYDANIGVFSSIPQRGDLIIFDEYSHASIRDGIALSHAKSYKFKHNDIDALASVLERHRILEHKQQHCYVVTESIFSMDGDRPNLKAMIALCKQYQAYLIVDEAHALGVFGNHGVGLVQQEGLESEVFARIMTFGKALGAHGAAVLGSKSLKQYLTNFARSLIYTTGLPPHSLATIKSAYHQLETTNAIAQLQAGIQHFKSQLHTLELHNHFIASDSSIQSCVVSGNTRVKHLAAELQSKNFDVKAILSPTVPEGHERLRICLHSYNTDQEITEVLTLLASLIA